MCLKAILYVSSLPLRWICVVVLMLTPTCGFVQCLPEALKDYQEYAYLHFESECLYMVKS